MMKAIMAAGLMAAATLAVGSPAEAQRYRHHDGHGYRGHHGGYHGAYRGGYGYRYRHGGYRYRPYGYGYARHWHGRGYYRGCRHGVRYRRCY